MARSVPKLYLVDASVYIFRAWYSMPDSMTDGEGNPINALYGYTSFLIDLLEETRATHIVVAFDESLTTSYRNSLYPEYKANRESPPDDLKAQFEWCREVTRALGVREFASGEYEADDIIGTIADKARSKGMKSVIVSRDKDLSQVLRSGDVYWDYASDRRITYRDAGEVFGARPERMADFLALTGDAVDNIPGVPGVGKKTAQVLMENFRSLEHIYENLHQIENLPIRGTKRVVEKLKAHRDDAFLARRLTEICYTVPLRYQLSGLIRKPPARNLLNEFFDRLGFGMRLRNRAEQLSRAFARDRST